MPTVNFFPRELMSMVCGLESGSKEVQISVQGIMLELKKLACFVMASYSKQWRE